MINSKTFKGRSGIGSIAMTIIANVLTDAS